ncbi:tail fiber assembly protein [Enterobacter mori]|nr:tail fiber assembly protein [Enterobacter mori]MCU3985480.1 tail fiber assembly protein [Enterobacter mori]
MSDIYAVVVDGVVVNMALWDGVNEWGPEEGVVLPAGEYVGIGWLYDGTEFIAPPVPEKSHQELVASAEEQKQSLINDANAYINGKQWPGKAAIGRLKTDELAQYNLWLDYLDALDAIDTSTVPDIDWPDTPA